MAQHHYVSTSVCGGPRLLPILQCLHVRKGLTLQAGCQFKCVSSNNFQNLRKEGAEGEVQEGNEFMKARSYKCLTLPTISFEPNNHCGRYSHTNFRNDETMHLMSQNCHLNLDLPDSNPDIFLFLQKFHEYLCI
jgi:hypothetical protein